MAKRLLLIPDRYRVESADWLPGIEPNQWDWQVVKNSDGRECVYDDSFHAIAAFDRLVKRYHDKRFRVVRETLTYIVFS